MSMSIRRLLGCIGVISLAIVGIGTLVILNWDSLSQNLSDAWDKQAKSTQATLFRWGELMSIGAQLKARYGAEPDVTYDTSTRDRTLSIDFSKHPLTEQVATETHAREIAAFAIGSTTKLEQIDAVRVLFQHQGGPGASDGSGSYIFSLADLLPSHSQATSVSP